MLPEGRTAPSEVHSCFGEEACVRDLVHIGIARARYGLSNHTLIADATFAKNLSNEHGWAIFRSAFRMSAG